MEVSGRLQRRRDVPYARVHLPDGQDLDLPVLGRRLDRATGTWWYRCEATLLACETTPAGRLVAEPRPVEFWAPYPQAVEPIDGEPYELLTTEPDERERRWRVTRANVSRGPHLTVHRDNCAQARDAVRRVTDREALVLLADRESARECAVCRPLAVLAPPEPFTGRRRPIA